MRVWLKHCSDRQLVWLMIGLLLLLVLGLNTFAGSDPTNHAGEYSRPS